jgi:hypothetical protein
MSQNAWQVRMLSYYLRYAAKASLPGELDTVLSGDKDDVAFWSGLLRGGA